MTRGYHVHANSIRQHLLHYPGPGPQLLLIPGDHLSGHHLGVRGRASGRTV